MAAAGPVGAAGAAARAAGAAGPGPQPGAAVRLVAAEPQPLVAAEPAEPPVAGAAGAGREDWPRPQPRAAGAAA